MSADYSSPETAEVVLAYLADHPTASVRSIAKAIGIYHTTVHRAIKRLVDSGELRVTRMGTGDQYPSTYEVLSHPADDSAARIDELVRLVVWARSRYAPRPLTADALHRYALDRAAWLRGEAPAGATPEENS